MILDLDIGNTRAKWRLMTSAGKVGGSGDGDPVAWGRGEFPSEWGRHTIRRVRVASVRSALLGTMLVEQFQARYDISPEFAKTTAHVSGGVRNGYVTPESLGIDRWLAMVAAYGEMKQSVLVVDAGSALTIDLVDGAGNHRGGYIIPGPRLMREILMTATDGIRMDVAVESASSDFGCSTAGCVLNGAVIAMVGSIEAAVLESERLLGQKPALFLTGGYADILVRLSGFRVCNHRPDLVMDGLQYVLP